MKDNNPDSPLLQIIKKHIQYLKKYQQEIIRPLCHFTYPSRQLITFYESKLIPKLEARKKTNSLTISDILFWYAPDLVTFVHQIQKYIVGANLKDKNTNLKAIKPDIGEDSTQESMLRIPQKFIEESLLLEVRSVITVCQNQSRNNEARNLQRFASILESCMHEYKKALSLTSQQVNQKVLLSLYENIPNPRCRIAIKFGMKFLFLTRLKMRAKKATKNLNQRKMRILELIDGQKKYVAGLDDYIAYIKRPIEALNILTKEEDMKLFSTIESIMNFHSQFYETLQNNYDNYHKYQLYGDIIKMNVPFFRIYTDYIMYADEAQALLLKLADTYEEVEDICNKFMLQKQKKASDQLKQPTFRIARYEMILNEIIKKTNPSHPDYEKLQQARQEGIASLRKINTTVDVTYRRNRLNQLQQEFGTQDKPIYVRHRQFLQEFSLFLVKDEKLEPVTVFVFSDFVMVIDESRKISKWVNADQNFYVRREEDNKIYRNIIKIHSDGFLTFSAGGEDKNFNKAEQFFDLLQRVSKQNQSQNKIVYVQVIGTEEIGSTSFAKHTEYIVEVKFLGLRKYLHLRFSEMKPILMKAQGYYKNDLHITDEEALRKNWFNNHKSKTIQDRKRTIQQILQKILNHEIVRNNPHFMLEELGIEKSFLNMVQSPQQRRQTTFGSNLKIARFQQSLIKRNNKEFKEAETILCATEIKLGRDLYHDPDQVLLSRKTAQSDKIDIYIHTMVGEDPVIVKITDSYTVEDVCHKVSKIIGLRMNRDFRLFHEIGKKQLRVLDQEHKITKIFSFPKNEIKVNGVLSQIIGSFKKIVAPDSHPTLIFKKYYFLPIEIEQSQSKKDLTRLRLLVYQIFFEIRDMKYQLSFDEYLLFLGMLIYIEYDGQVPYQSIPHSYVLRVIPETIFKLKNYSEEQWISRCKPHIQRLTQEITKIVDYNRQQLKIKKIKADSVSKTALYFGHRHLCSQIVINKIKSNPIYGSNLFYVQPYKATYDKLVTEGCKMAYNMWLAIKVESLNLLTPSSKETVLELKYKDIQKIFVYSEAIIFKMDGISTCEYRLNTYQSFEISQLVKYNRALNDTLQELERNEDLIQKARMYKQELLIYRNTYDKSERETSQISHND